jgi:hypothetical protein
MCGDRRCIKTRHVLPSDKHITYHYTATSLSTIPIFASTSLLPILRFLDQTMVITRRSISARHAIQAAPSKKRTKKGSILETSPKYTQSKSNPGSGTAPRASAILDSAKSVLDKDQDIMPSTTTVLIRESEGLPADTQPKDPMSVVLYDDCVPDEPERPDIAVPVHDARASPHNMSTMVKQSGGTSLTLSAILAVCEIPSSAPAVCAPQEREAGGSGQMNSPVSKQRNDTILAVADKTLDFKAQRIASRCTSPNDAKSSPMRRGQQGTSAHVRPSLPRIITDFNNDEVIVIDDDDDEKCAKVEGDGDSMMAEGHFTSYKIPTGGLSPASSSPNESDDRESDEGNDTDTDANTDDANTDDANTDDANTDDANTDIDTDTENDNKARKLKRRKADRELPPGVVSWSEPGFERDQQKKVHRLFVGIQTRWLSVRAMDCTKNLPAIRSFDSQLQNAVREMHHEDAIDHDVMCDLEQDCLEMEEQIKTRLRSRNRRVLRKFVRKLVSLREESWLLNSINEYRMTDGDEKDKSYCPGKAQR